MSTYDIDLLKDSSFREEMAAQTGVLLRIADKMGAYDDQISWEAYRQSVRKGIAKSELPVGSQLIDEWEVSAGGTKYPCPWDVAHYDDEGNAYLKWHWGLANDVQFDAAEAIYFAPEGGLPAGQYHIAISIAYGNGWVAGQNICFTLNQAMAAGDQLVINTGSDSAVNPTNGRAWNVYAKGSTTSKDSGTTSNSSAGTLLGSTSSEGVGYTNGQINAPQRVVYGYNRWSQSAIRQYLNSAGAANAWWQPQNGWDRPPSQLASIRGFLAGFGEEFLAVLEESEITTAINTVEGSAQAAETTRDKIFLPSLTEMYINPQYAEGVEWDYFKELAHDAGLAGKFAQYGTYPILRTFRISATTSAVYSWSRSANRGAASGPWSVYSSGSVTDNAAISSGSGRPACIIKKS